jgi:ABC-type branched-subunit amino acid transport system substrate-binding protein
VLSLLSACGGPSVTETEPRPQAPTVGGLPPLPESLPLPAPPPSAPVEQAPIAPIVPPPSNFVEVAMMVPLSGRDAGLGRSLIRAAQMAVFDVADERFRLNIYDDGGTAEGAAAVTTTALQDGARLIIGPVFAGSVASVTPLTRASGVNVISFSNSRAVAGNGAFLIGLLPKEQVERVVTHASREGVQRIAALLPDSPFGQQVAADLAEAADRYGVKVVRTEVYGPKLDDLTAAVKRLARWDERRAALAAERDSLRGRGSASALDAASKLDKLDTFGDLDFDALLIAEGGERLRSIGALLPYYDIDTSRVRLLGLASWRVPGIGREPALVGGWFAAPVSETRTAFEARYKSLFGEAPHGLAALAYDAAALAAFLGRSGTPPSFDTTALTSPNGFSGTSGIFRFLPNGEPQRGLAVMEITPRGFDVRSPPPTTFEALSN